MSEPEVKIGKVKQFNTEKGFGFIKVPGSVADVFVHARELRRSGVHKALNEGDMLKFSVNVGEKGLFATNISFAEEA